MGIYLTVSQSIRGKQTIQLLDPYISCGMVNINSKYNMQVKGAYCYP